MVLELQHPALISCLHYEGGADPRLDEPAGGAEGGAAHQGRHAPRPGPRLQLLHGPVQGKGGQDGVVLRENKIQRYK